MSDYRQQFVDHSPGRRETRPSLTAVADARGAAATAGAHVLPERAIDREYARRRAEWFEQQMVRYANDPPVGIGGDPHDHAQYQSMARQQRGYILEEDALGRTQMTYSLARQPAFNALAGFARARAIGSSLSIAQGAEFGAVVNQQSVSGVMRENTPLNASNQTVQIAGGRYLTARTNLHAAAYGMQNLVAGQVMNELRSRIHVDQSRIDQIHAKIRQVTSIVEGIEGALTAFSGNVGGVATAASAIDTALDTLNGATTRRFAGQDAGTIPTSERMRARQAADEQEIAGQPDPRAIGIDHDDQGRSSVNMRDVERHSRLNAFDRHQHAANRANAAEDQAAGHEHRRAAAESNRSAFAEVGRAERRHEEPHIEAAAEPHAEGGTGEHGESTTHEDAGGNPLAPAGHAAHVGAEALGALAHVVEAGMELYHREELENLSNRIAAANSAISGWEEVASRDTVAQALATYSGAKEAFTTEAHAYEASLAARREHYQQIGRLADEAEAGAGHQVDYDGNSQGMLYMSAVREAESEKEVASPAVADSLSSVNAALSLMDHRHEPYQTRDNAWAGAGVVEPEGPDEPVLFQMRDALTGWQAEAEADSHSFATEATSAQGAMGDY
jgi:hypothetical protein